MPNVCPILPKKDAVPRPEMRKNTAAFCPVENWRSPAQQELRHFQAFRMIEGRKRELFPFSDIYRITASTCLDTAPESKNNKEMSRPAKPDAEDHFNLGTESPIPPERQRQEKSSPAHPPFPYKGKIPGTRSRIRNFAGRAIARSADQTAEKIWKFSTTQ